MTTNVAQLLRKQSEDHLDYLGLSFFDLPNATYTELVAGMADEHVWHFENNTTESHMAFLRQWGPRLVEWSAHLPFPQGSVHLDLGAGEGILSYLVAQRGYHSIAVELSATILHSATLFQSGLYGPHCSKHSSMDLWVADIYDIPLKAASVDFVTIKQLLHHLHDPDRLLQEVSRVLKPNGIVYIWEPFYVSIPLLRWYFLKHTRPRELSLGIHHVYHTYWTYRRLFKRWLNALSITGNLKMETCGTTSPKAGSPTAQFMPKGASSPINNRPSRPALLPFGSRFNPRTSSARTCSPMDFRRLVVVRTT